MSALCARELFYSMERLTCMLFLINADIQLETPIVKVVHNVANKDFTRQRIMVKGTVVQIDADVFKSW